MPDSKENQARITFTLRGDGEYDFSHEATSEIDTILLVAMLTDLKNGKLYGVAMNNMSPEAEIVIEGAVWGEDPPLVDLSEEQYEDE